VVVRLEVLRERLSGLRATVEHLAALRASGRLDDPTIEWAIERGLQVGAQALFDIGNHVLSGGYAERPSEYSQVAPLLVRHGVIPSELEVKLRGMAGFRNLLVHDYARVDPARVHQVLRDRLEDLGEFADAIDDWLARQEGEPAG
jgi:uncharacterized protein YutE (UPF0331/DUF86 family)